jgi:hypothetical protein
MTDDISETLIAKSDQLNAADLMGGPITVKAINVSVSKSSDQPVVIKIDGDRQPYKPCKSMRRLLAFLWGTSSKEWIGHSMTLYCDPDVLWAGAKAGGIRISHVTGIQESCDIPLRASKHKVVTYTVHPLIVQLPPYPDENIGRNREAWIKSFNDNNTPAGLVNKIKTQYALTQEQEATILNLPRPEQ